MVSLEKIKNRKINPDKIIGSKKANVAVSPSKIPKTSRLMFITPFIISGSTFFRSRYQFSKLPNKQTRQKQALNANSISPIVR
jgi:hypothetical protein